MIIAHHEALLSCDNISPVEMSEDALAALGDKGAPMVACKKQVSAKLMLTTQGTWIPKQPENWQLVRIPGLPHSMFGCYCPAHHVEIAKPLPPSGLVVPR